MALQNSASRHAMDRHPVYRVMASILAGLVACLLVLSSSTSLHDALHLALRAQTSPPAPGKELNPGSRHHRCSHHHGHRTVVDLGENSGVANDLPGESPVESPVDHQEGCAICLFASAVIDEVREAGLSAVLPRALVLIEWSVFSTEPLVSSETPPSERGPPVQDWVAA